MMKRGGGDVRLLCGPEYQAGSKMKHQANYLRPEVVFTVVFIIVLGLTLAVPALQRHLIFGENSEEDIPLDLSHGPQDLDKNTTNLEQQHLAAEKVNQEEENTVVSHEEVEGLLNIETEDSIHSDTIAFLLPLRGDQGALGIRLGRGLKTLLEASGSLEHQDTIHYPQEKARNSSSSLPTHILVRDTRNDPDASRRLTQHFYEVHNTSHYFGLLTDEEAFTVAQWARSRAPGTRVVTPTATTIYLDEIRNVVRVQPSGRILAAALADFLDVLQSLRPLVVARTSIHTDIFLNRLSKLGIKPSKVIRYYPTTNMEELAGRVGVQVKGATSPVLLLLGDSESWHLVAAADRLFSAVWILPFPTQLLDNMRTNRSELLAFMYRPHDPVPRTFLKSDPLLSPIESVLAASHRLLMGGQQWWRGVYVVATKVAVNSLSAGVRLLGTTEGWIPLLHYSISHTGVTRRLYQELLVTKELLQPFIVGNQCRLVLRYVEELTGVPIVSEAYPFAALPTLLLPADRGAQLHVDCPHQHTDLRCWIGVGENHTLTCRGTKQGSHELLRKCGREMSISVAGSQGCTGAFGLVCRNGRSLGCLLSGLCSSLTNPSLPLFQCGNVNLHTFPIPH